MGYMVEKLTCKLPKFEKSPYYKPDNSSLVLSEEKQKKIYRRQQTSISPLLFFSKLPFLLFSFSMNFCERILTLKFKS